MCLKEQRILITLDNDINNPLLHPRESLTGILILRPPTQGKKAVLLLFTTFLDNFQLEKKSIKFY
jgi:hypothetical protein